MIKNKDVVKHFPTVFHAAALLHHLYVGYTSNEVDFSKTTDPRILEMKRYGLRYLTSWNMVIQTLYFGVALVKDVLKLRNSDKQLKDRVSTLQGYIFTSLMFPCTFFTTVMFWSIYNINREWVLPEAIDEIMPRWLNHSIHTNIAIFVAVEMLTTTPRMPSFKQAMVGLNLVLGLYHVVFFFTFFETGRWLYGVFHALTWYEQTIFMTVNYITTLFFVQVGISLIELKKMLIKKKTKSN